MSPLGRTGPLFRAASLRHRFAWAIAAAVALAAPSAWAGGNAEQGKALTQKLGCASCHGEDFSTPTDAAYPRLAGQHYDYLVHALTAYQRGNTAANGRVNPIMQGFAGQLSANEVQDVAAYLSGLPGKLVVKR